MGYESYYNIKMYSAITNYIMKKLKSKRLKKKIYLQIKYTKCKDHNNK